APASIVGQAFVNLGAVTGILPVTGVPLPLVSSGGSSLIVTMSMIGILMNIASRERRVCSNEAYEGDSKRRRDGRPHLSRARAVKSAGIR
ncbi:MAG: FtsW/RodA/SpoVE family cell cycle protein, partial [Chloroflexi bacterium]|nr:FtsW/RodA/SpoVE family cell cycle protein [Chloroflexota bacterium]